MKIKELMEFLSNCNPEDEVVLSKDSEGNDYSPLDGFGECIYVSYSPLKNSEWGGNVYPKEITQEMLDRGFTEDDDLYHEDDGINAVALYPAN